MWRCWRHDFSLGRSNCFTGTTSALWCYYHAFQDCFGRILRQQGVLKLLVGPLTIANFEELSARQQKSAMVAYSPKKCSCLWTGPLWFSVHSFVSCLLFYQLSHPHHSVDCGCSVVARQADRRELLRISRPCWWDFLLLQRCLDGSDFDRHQNCWNAAHHQHRGHLYEVSSPGAPDAWSD